MMMVGHQRTVPGMMEPYSMTLLEEDICLYISVKSRLVPTLPDQAKLLKDSRRRVGCYRLANPPATSTPHSTCRVYFSSW